MNRNMNTIFFISLLLLTGCTKPVPPNTELTDGEYIGSFKGVDVYYIHSEDMYIAIGKDATTVAKHRTKRSKLVTITLNGKVYQEIPTKNEGL